MDCEDLQTDLHSPYNWCNSGLVTPKSERSKDPYHHECWLSGKTLSAVDHHKQEERLGVLKWPSLELRRKFICLVQMYKIIFGNCDIDPHIFLDFNVLSRFKSYLLDQLCQF